MLEKKRYAISILVNLGAREEALKSQDVKDHDVYYLAGYYQKLRTGVIIHVHRRWTISIKTALQFNTLTEAEIVVDKYLTKLKDVVEIIRC